jgi:hypothetical protein
MKEKLKKLDKHIEIQEHAEHEADDLVASEVAL